MFSFPCPNRPQCTPAPLICRIQSAHLHRPLFPSLLPPPPLSLSLVDAPLLPAETLPPPSSSFSSSPSSLSSFCSLFHTNLRSCIADASWPQAPGVCAAQRTERRDPPLLDLFPGEVPVLRRLEGDVDRSSDAPQEEDLSGYLPIAAGKTYLQEKPSGWLSWHFRGRWSSEFGGGFARHLAFSRSEGFEKQESRGRGRLGSLSLSPAARVS